MTSSEGAMPRVMYVAIRLDVSSDKGFIGGRKERRGLGLPIERSLNLPEWPEVSKSNELALTRDGVTG